MAALTKLTKDQVIQNAFHASGALRDMSLTNVRRHRDRARDKISLCEIPDLSEYIKAIKFREWVFKVEPAKEDISWEDALTEVHMKANARMYELSAPDLIFTAHEDLCNRMEVAAIHDFLNRTRALLK